MRKLEKEYECCSQWIGSQTQQGQVKPHNTGSPYNNKRLRKGGFKEPASSSTVKYAKWQTDILMHWMIENKDNPFPNQSAIESLTDRTGLSNSQVVNWTTNVRKRNRKATCENGKKPHHFIDFLFLVQDREEKARAAVEESGMYHTNRPYEPPRPTNSSFSSSYQKIANDMTSPDTCISKNVFDEVEESFGRGATSVSTDSMLDEGVTPLDWIDALPAQQQPVYRDTLMPSVTLEEPDQFSTNSSLGDLMDELGGADDDTLSQFVQDLEFS